VPIPVHWDVRRAIRLYRDGWSLRQISSDVGVAVSAVRTELLKVGVELWPAVHPARADVDTGSDCDCVTTRGLSWAQVAQRVEMTGIGASNPLPLGPEAAQPNDSPCRGKASSLPDTACIT
jgi:hypothetical protein